MNKPELERHLDQIAFSANALKRHMAELCSGNISHKKGTMTFEVNFILQKLQDIHNTIKGEQ